MRRAIATAIDQVERLGGIGQRDHQGMIAPNAVVGDVDTLLALGIGRDEGAIHIQDRSVEERGGLLSPDAEADPIDDVHQDLQKPARPDTYEQLHELRHHDR